MNTEAVRTYIAACNREHAECAQELVDALNNNTKVAQLGQRDVPLNDIDICCVAETIRALGPESALKVLNLEENSFGLQGVQAIMEAIEANPGRVKELRLGKNNLKDQAAVAIGHTLSRDGYGLKVLDLSENAITKLGVIPIAAALQNPTSDIVELSFHNNKIEGDAAVFLSQAVRGAPRLKHLHLGYNSLRDSGAAQLAKSLPYATCLSTLDLTANRIGHEGGLALAHALLSPTCTLQRLNLRHNLLDSDAIDAYAEVLEANRSLIQLFLGYMNPTPDVAARVLQSAKGNTSLLLLDVYGWKLEPQEALALIRGLQEDDGAIAAIVTDVCQSVASAIDEGNILRENRDQHPIYVGPDDRDAYLATKSQRRFSRAQSRRQSRMSSVRASRARDTNDANDGAGRRSRSRAGSHRRRTVEGGHADGEAMTDGATSSRRHSRHHSRRSSRRSSRHAASEQAAATPTTDGAAWADGAENAAAASRRHGSSRRSHRSSSRTGRHHHHTKSVPSPQEHRELVPVAPESALSVSKYQPEPQRDSYAIRRAHESVEATRSPSRQEMYTGPTATTAAVPAAAAPPPTNGRARSLYSVPGSVRESTPLLQSDLGEVEELLSGLRDTPCDPQTVMQISAIVQALHAELRIQRSYYRRELWALAARVEALEERRECRCGGVADGPAVPQSNGGRAPSQPAPFARTTSGVSSSGIGGAAPQQQQPASFCRSLSRMSESGAADRAQTPLVRPTSEARDMLPELPRPNDESGQRRPEEASLQRSASVLNFPPRIEPSPAQDANPPRPKSVSHNF